MLYSILSILSFVYVCKTSFSPDSILEKVRCGKDFCKSVKCEKLTDCPKDHIVLRASYCKCCDVCIPSLEEGENCEISTDGSLSDIKKPKWCRSGLKCINGRCEKDEQLCVKEREFRKELRSKGIFASNLWFPDCDEAGNYLPKQTKNRAMCVNTDGTRIFGQQESELSVNMTCGCSRYIEKLKNTKNFMTEPHIHCTPSGDYDEVQCIGDLCYCADYRTGKTEGRIVKIKYLDELPCKNDEPDTIGYLKPCELEMIRNRKLFYEFQLKGIRIYQEDPVVCDPDGTFSPVQCSSSICACTNTVGVGIKSYYIDIENLFTKRNTQMCSCARDSITHGSFPKLSCTGFGSNMPLHCFRDDVCFCVDEDGDLISEERPKTDISKSKCEEAIRTLQYPEEPTPTEETRDETTDYSYENFD